MPFRGLYLPNAWPQTLQTSKKHTFRVSAFHRYHWFGIKLLGCAQDSRKKREKCCFWILDLALPTLQNSGIFLRQHPSSPPLWRFATEIAAIRRASSRYRTQDALQVLQKHSRFGLAWWSRPCADRGLSRPTSAFRTVIGVCKILPDWLIFGSTRAKNLFLPAQGGWLAGVCLSHASIVWKRLRPPGSPIILVSSDPYADTQLQGERLQRGR